VEHRRSDRRYDRRVPVEFVYEGKTHAAHSRNISLGGIFIDTEMTLPFGARVLLRFRVPTQTEPIEVEGQVRWAGSSEEEPSERGIGLRFEGLRARDVWALNKFFDRPQE
jgi:uncharacterized protein (TIGR02266 family)